MDKIISIRNILFGYQEGKDIFRNYSIDIPKGVTTFIGQNGTGKSTLMLLAAGRLLPEEGVINLLNVNTKEITSEEELNQKASIIYQNMEFDTQETIGNLLNYVFENGNHNSKDPELVDELITVFELKESLYKQTNTASKGEMQRVVIAFALLFGSPIILMDEPVFALEDHQKDKILQYIKDYAHKHSINVVFSIHDLDISRKYSDNVVLFNKDRSTIVGPTEKILSEENLEKAYQVPMHLLYEREKLNRETLLKKEAPTSGIIGKVLE